MNAVLRSVGRILLCTLLIVAMPVVLLVAAFHERERT